VTHEGDEERLDRRAVGVRLAVLVEHRVENRQYDGSNPESRDGKSEGH
jgi:hypothetical protein